MDALYSRYPNLAIRFEDFISRNGFCFLNRYQNNPMFNTDVQGTGSVIPGGPTNAAQNASKESGRPPYDHHILMAGEGSAAVSVGKQPMSFFTCQGLSEDEARERIYIKDSKGLVTKHQWSILDRELKITIQQDTKSDISRCDKRSGTA
ncbi:uncharacterized protein UDID_19285 [Ustilago sp. UG-2017a]|nr:uncharacterized protein UDID_19285 [Ustilago sp. UG-2017a]